jgi:catechol 2,3-dioxygenase-like lactoylglutathione lyase family enzyme
MNAPSRRNILISAFAASVMAAIPGVPVKAAAANPLDGWREAVVIVPDFAPWIETLTTVGGWEVAARSGPDDSLNALWALPEGARTEQVLMRDIGTDGGMIRLAVVTGAPQRRIRAHDQAWETGGLSALDIRVVDMEATQRALEARGWNSASDPVRYSIFGKEVVEWAPRSPDGVRLSFIQRISPPLVGLTELKYWGRAGNAAIVAADMDGAAAFYEKVLGLKQVTKSNNIGTEGANVMGLPANFERSLEMEIRGFAGQKMGGGIELIAMPQARGRDYAADAHPPNLGTAALRFFVPDIAAAVALCKAGGVLPATGICDIPLAPYDRARAFAVRAPDGVWLEFIQVRGS